MLSDHLAGSAAKSIARWSTVELLKPELSFGAGVLSAIRALVFGYRPRPR